MYLCVETSVTPHFEALDVRAWYIRNLSRLRYPVPLSVGTHKHRRRTALSNPHFSALRTRMYWFWKFDMLQYWKVNFIIDNVIQCKLEDPRYNLLGKTLSGSAFPARNYTLHLLRYSRFAIRYFFHSCLFLCLRCPLLSPCKLHEGWSFFFLWTAKAGSGGQQGYLNVQRSVTPHFEALDVRAWCIAVSGELCPA